MAGNPARFAAGLKTNFLNESELMCRPSGLVNINPFGNADSSAASAGLIFTRRVLPFCPVTELVAQWVASSTSTQVTFSQLPASVASKSVSLSAIASSMRIPVKATALHSSR